MTHNTTQTHALKHYEKALSLFKKRHFIEAQQAVQEYRKHVDYAAFQHIDNRREEPGCATVIIATNDLGEGLFTCLNSLKEQEGHPFETIVIHHVTSNAIKDVFSSQEILLLECPFPFTPSEAWNIGASHARTDLLIFLNGDTLAEPGFVKSAVRAFEDHPFLGIRGRILSESAETKNGLADLYDRGDYPLPALLDIHGNMAVPRALYHAAEGMNSLLFEEGGLDLTARLLRIRPDGDIFYWPGMAVKNDSVSREKAPARSKQQALVEEYFRVMHPVVLELRERYANGREPFTRSGRDPDSNVSLEKETRILQLRIHALEMELDEILTSLSFRVGLLIREFISSPLKKGPMFPFRLGKLVIEYFAGSGHSRLGDIWKTHVAGTGMYEQPQYTRPAREEHRFTLFKEFRPYRKACNSTLRIACILSPWMYSCLDLEAELIPLSPDDWQEVLQKKKPDFLLVQPLLEKSGSWLEYFSASNSPPAELEKIMDYCKGERIATVFWDTEAHTHFPLFAKTAVLFDRIFAVDPKSVKEYNRLLKRDVEHLGPAVQPVLHNPFKPENHVRNGFTILLDGWADILENPAAFEFLKPLSNKGLHIVESRYRLMANKLDDLPALRENIMGCISYSRLLNALRHYRVLIMPNQSLSSPMARSWRALEALACGCNVVMSGSQKGWIPEDLLIRTDDGSLGKKTLELLKDESARLQRSHLARRKIYASHTYAHRIRTICESLEIEHDWEEFPLVSVVTPTKRPEFIEGCLKKFRSQDYPNKELLIVINTDAVDIEKMQGMVSKFPDVRIFQIHQERNIGTCLNFAVARARGKYWFKMDDDDFYGPHYLQDMVHLAETADVHIMGKPPGFIYSEGEDRVYLRNGAIHFQNTIGGMNSSHLCGATLGGKRDLFPGFSDIHRACVDTRFVEEGKAMGQTIMWCDIWNFIAFRAGDKSGHTWRQDDKRIIKNAAPFHKGLPLDKIMI